MADTVERLWATADELLESAEGEARLRSLLLETATEIRTYEAHIDRLQAQVAAMDTLLVEERKRQLADLKLTPVGMAHRSVDDRRWVVHSDTSMHMNDRQAFVILTEGETE